MLTAKFLRALREPRAKFKQVLEICAHREMKDRLLVRA